MVRPTKLNSELCEEICALHSQGINQSHIAKQVGIDRSTLRNWLHKGKNARSGRHYLFYQDWLKAHEDYLIVNPPKNTYKPRNARETIKGYAKFKEEVLKRDGHTCQCCGYDDLLEVHHLYGVKENPEMATDLSNGITLCKFCHQKYHHIYSRYNINPVDFNEFMHNFKVIK